MRLEQMLADSGCKMSAEAFEDLLRTTYAEMHGTMPDEQLYFNPEEALKFCVVITRRARCRNLTPPGILRSLSNLRKRSALKATG